MVPNWSFLDEFRKLNNKYKSRQKQDFDRRHCTHELPSIPDETEVWITSDGERSHGKVISPSSTPRSYLIDTRSGVIRRSRQHLNVSPEEHSESESHCEQSDTPHSGPEQRPKVIKRITRSQTGTAINPPDRFV